MTPEVLEASRALNDLLDEDPNAVRVGDLVINEDTGEILEWADGITDQMEALVMRDMQAKQNIEGWERARMLLKLAIGRLLDQQGVRSFSTPYGKPTWMAGRRTESVDVEGVKHLMEEREVSQAEALAVFAHSTKALDPKKIREYLPDCEGVISVKEGKAYVQVNPPTQAAPVIERVS